MATQPLSKDTVYDGWFDFAGGVNTGFLPALLPTNQLSNAVNCTVRGGFPTTRPRFRKCALNFQGNAVFQALFETGRFQGCCYYRPDSGPESLIVAIGGHLFAIKVVNNQFTVSNISIANQTITTLPFVVPPLNGTVQVTVISTTNILPGVPIVIGDKNYVVVSIDSATTLTVTNIDDTPLSVEPSGSVLLFFDVNPASRTQSWLWQSEKWVIVNDGQSMPIFYDGATSRRSLGITANPPELTAGRMGTYWKGRNWWCNPDGITFRAGDAVYSSSGSGDRRDAVLKQSQNAFLATAAGFSIPGNAGIIGAMQFVNILDTSLGQGPLQVATPDLIFGCDASVDNTTWQNTTNPLLSVSQISYGALSQSAFILVNGDLYYRSTDGIRSLAIGRREVMNPGNTPLSREVARFLDADELALLPYASMLLFDNRVLCTNLPVYTNHGVYHRGLVVLNADVLSNIQGKKPSVWEGLYTGINTLALLKGQFAGVERAFAFSLNTDTLKIELYEILTSASTEINDNNGYDIPVRWSFETFSMFRKTGIKEYKRVLLQDGELYVSDVKGRVDFRILWRPDQHTCFVPWTSFSICNQQVACLEDINGCITINEYQPGYRNRLGFGEPPNTCDASSDEPLRQFYTCELRVEVQGHCRVDGARLMATIMDQPIFAPVAGCTEAAD